MDSEAFRISAVQLQVAYENELAELRRTVLEEQQDLGSFLKLKDSLDERHNEKVKALNLSMAQGQIAPHYN